MEQIKEEKKGRSIWKTLALVGATAFLSIVAYKNREKIGAGLKMAGGKVKGVFEKKQVKPEATPQNTDYRRNSYDNRNNNKYNKN